MLNKSEVDILYERREYIIFKGGDSDYIVYNTNKRFKQGHSHLKSYKRAKEVVRHSINKHFPLHWSNYFIHTMIRLTEDEVFKSRLEELRTTRKAKGRKKNYRNINNGSIY